MATPLKPGTPNPFFDSTNSEIDVGKGRFSALGQEGPNPQIRDLIMYFFFVAQTPPTSESLRFRLPSFKHAPMAQWQQAVHTTPGQRARFSAVMPIFADFSERFYHEQEIPW